MKTTPSVVIRIALWLILLFGGAALAIYLDLRYFKELLFSPLFHIITFFMGIGILKLAFNAAAKGGRELAKKGREGDMPRLETNRLVTTGIYSCARHPMLFGLMLLPLGFALLLGSPSFIFGIAPLEAAFIAFMVLVFEEMECRKKFGKSYEEYAKKIPPYPKNLECLKRLFL